MHNKKKFIVSSFYKFVYLPEPKIIKNLFTKELSKLNVKGTFIIGNEGINGSFSVKEHNFKKICKIIEDLLSIKLKFKFQKSFNHSFLRLKIKLKNEIVTIGLKNINPQKNTGKYLDPESWEELIKSKDSIIIDTRNDYESDVGSFKSSVESKTKNFRGFPAWIKKMKKN